MTAHDHSQFSTASSDRPPASDVSPWVGLVGLAGLFAWIAFCRNYPAIATALDLPGPREVMSGPYASLVALLCAALPMVAWSVVVDKVHRNPSTGIVWGEGRKWGADWRTSATKIIGLWATFAVIAALYCLARWYWGGAYLFAMKILGAAIIPIAIATVPYVLWIDRYMKQPRDAAWHFGALLTRQAGWDRDTLAKHWRAWIIKGFFTAFMLSIVPGGFAFIVEHDLSDIASNPVVLATLCIELLFVIDVQIGTVGYLLTMRPLDAHIRSGNPFLAGWIAALACYPPLAWGVMGDNGIFNYQVNTRGWDVWLADSTIALTLWGAMLVALTAMYAWATVAFGIRFSNLTYRGVITNGPYRFTRHPAYLSKNLFWWCATMPFFVVGASPVDAIRNTAFLACISALYYWRARTEEAHLLAEDPKYRAYYDWMAEHGVITSRMERVVRKFRPKPVAA
ncbi:MAG: isoprenylcysteine carboxylmethyltransferase family protein [Parerythrobacter sp.]